MKQKKPSLKKIARMSRNDLPATVGLVKAVRDELKTEIRGLQHRLEAKISGLESKISSYDARFSSYDARFSSHDARFSSHDARFNTLEAKIDAVHVIVHQQLILFEEQRSENRIVLDGLKSVLDTKWPTLMGN